MSNLMVIESNERQSRRLVIDSREVADMTGKQHAHLLRDIKGYLDILDPNPNLDSAQFFIPSTYYDAQKQERPCYLHPLLIHREAPPRASPGESREGKKVRQET